MAGSQRLVLAAVGALALLAAAQPALAQQRGAALKDGPHRDLVQGLCTGCHQVNMIASSTGYTRGDWDKLVATMVDLPAEQKAQVLDYLEAAYPPNNPRPSTPAPGPLQIAFKEYVAPQLGQRSRDPVQAPDGMVWWVGQSGNTIGRLNPATGDMKEWTLPPRSLAHSVNIDAQGGVWYMGNGNGTIGKFDPATGQAKVYNMPDPAARDPHTAEFDRNGILWFTLQNSNMLGRFDPKTEEIKLVKIERPNVRPYGIKIAADGSAWIACNGADCILHLDTKTMTVREIKLPGAGQTTVRRLDLASNGDVWYVNSGMGKLGRYDVKTGAITEWPSPSGARSHPYAIAVINDIVWYNESGVRPDMLVRFDPKTEKFQSWPVASNGVYAGIVRHMRATPDGNLWLHQSSTNRIIHATLPPAR